MHCETLAKNAPSGAIPVAIEELFEKLRLARVNREKAEATVEEEQANAIQLERLIAGLVALLPAADQSKYRARLSPAAPSKGGIVFDNVVSLFRDAPNQQWTPTSVQAALEKKGVSADTKAIANILAYLARSGKLVRAARGHYVSQGWMIVTSDEIEADEMSREKFAEL